MLAGLLHALHVGHAWLDRADAFCWKRLSETKVEGGYELAAVFCFLNNAPDQRRAVLLVEEIADEIPNATFFALDPEDISGEASLTPLHLAPTPESMGAGLFAPELLGAHIDHLLDQQQADGGWPIAWEPPSTTAALEWRGVETVRALVTLQEYGAI
jgi:hypothetical protein